MGVFVRTITSTSDDIVDSCRSKLEKLSSSSYVIPSAANHAQGVAPLVPRGPRESLGVCGIAQARERLMASIEHHDSYRWEPDRDRGVRVKLCAPGESRASRGTQ
jgi:hypothetical protein